MPNEMMQHERRTEITAPDQHGRLWATCIDLTDKYKGACGPVIPQFKAPWVPEAKYIRCDGRTMKVTLDYDRAIADCQEAEVRWEERLHTLAVQMFGTKAAQAIEERDKVLFKEVGPKPASSLLPKAAKAGNPWLLGVPGYAMPEWAAPLFVKRLTPQEEELANLAYAAPDVSDVDKYEDYSDAHDPDATGGKRVKVRQGTRHADKAA